jgi:hypothetical protein
LWRKIIKRSWIWFAISAFILVYRQPQFFSKNIIFQMGIYFRKTILILFRAFPASWRIRLSALAFFAETRKKELKQMPQSLTRILISSLKIERRKFSNIILIYSKRN